MFKRDEAIPLKQNNETKRCTFEIWFAHKEIVNWEDDGNDEDIDFVSYFRILSLKTVTFFSRHYEHSLCWGLQAGNPMMMSSYEDMGVEWVNVLV